MDFQAIYDEALIEARKAGLGCRPTPMIVGAPKTPLGDEIDYSKPVYYVDDGACGFAWVVVKPGNCKFAKWLTEKGLARRHYQGGVSIWVSEYGQSVERKEAHARALASALRDKTGVDKIWSESRLD